MAFDRSDTADLAALKSEVETDPISMGYPLNNPNQIIKIINDPDDNVGNDQVAEDLTTGNLLANIVPSDMEDPQFTEGERTYIHSFTVRGFEEVIEAYRTKIRDMFQSASQTVANLDAMQRTLSRAEVLFGEGTVLVRDDWYAARNS